MSTHHHQTATIEMDNTAADSVSSTPRSSHHHPLEDSTTQPQQRVRFMCSFGGKILPRPHDNQLRYVGGDTRIVAVHRHGTTFASLLSKLSKLAVTPHISVKYQLPNEELDALISVTTDEDVENMMEEYDRLAQTNKTARLRLFLFPNDSDSRASSINSLLDGSAKREHWFFDALNGGPGPGSVLERGRSEASSIVSEVPDYLFGLDNSDDQPRDCKLKNKNGLNENVQSSDPGSPAPVVSSPFHSTSSTGPNPSVIPNLPPVKTKLTSQVSNIEQKEMQVEGLGGGGGGEVMESGGSQHQPAYLGHQMWNYPGQTVQHIPIYYVPSPVQPGNMVGQSVQMRSPYVQPYPVPAAAQVPVAFPPTMSNMGQIYGGVRAVAGMDPYDARMVTGGANQAIYYNVRSGGGGAIYPGAVGSSGEEIQNSGADGNAGRVSQS